MTPSEAMLGTDFDRIQRSALVVGVIGLLVCVIGVFVDRDQFFRSYLFAYLFWLGLALGSLGVLMLNHVVGGRWGIVSRRVLEAGTRTTPLMAVLLIPVLLGIGSLYFWSHGDIVQHDQVLQQKQAYLNVPFFIIRLVVYFLIWMFYGINLRRWSLKQDQTGDPQLLRRMKNWSAPGLVVFTLSGTFAFFDLIMSLEPHWFSTIYGAMFLIGQMLETLAFVTAFMVVLSRRSPLREIMTVQHFHDLGNMMLAFTCLWAYLSFSQFLIIWAGNIPGEIPWYMRRLFGGWGAIAVILVLFHFLVPFIILLQRFVKRNPDVLQKVAIGMILIRLIDVFWVVMPAFSQPEFKRAGFHLSWMDFAAPIGLGGIWIAFFIWNLKRYPIVPVGDPRLVLAPGPMVEGLH
jgi:hypothetical protein